MEYKIVEVQNLSGNGATIYSILEKDEKETLFGKFITDFTQKFKDEIKNIVGRLKIMANDNEYGARSCYFKSHEGNYGDSVCALADFPNEKLRLYCIRFSEKLLILGGGGEKPAGTTSYQHNEILNSAAEVLKEVSKDLRELYYKRGVKYPPKDSRLIE